MAWIKRNLFFLIGTLVALALMVLGIFYLLGQINNEHQVTDDIEKQYSILTDLNKQKPHPGNDKTDNIKAAQEQDKALRDYIKKERGLFQPIASIPDAPPGKISASDFATELRNTVAELRRSAEQQAVRTSADYFFSFEAQKKSLKFAPGSLDALASHLGEIKAICDILFAAKINFLEGIQREIISTNEDTNPSDYLASRKTVSTPLADLTPYQVTFRCFSAELAQVLASFATSPYGFMVQTINVEPVNAAEDSSQMPGTNPFPNPQPQPQPNFPRNVPGLDNRRFPPGFTPPPGTAPAVAAPGGRPTAFLNEKPFRVTLLIQVVKPKPAAAK